MVVLYVHSMVMMYDYSIVMCCGHRIVVYSTWCDSHDRPGAADCWSFYWYDCWSCDSRSGSHAGGSGTLHHLQAPQVAQEACVHGGQGGDWQDQWVGPLSLHLAALCTFQQPKCHH